MKYVWQKYNARNHNHYICEVWDDINPNDKPVWSCYFDGTQSAALQHFSKLAKIKSYLSKPDQYDIFVHANSLQLNWIDNGK